MDRRILPTFLILGIAVLIASSPSLAFAAEGDTIFKQAAVGILRKVLPGSFGAMLAMVAGVLALVAAAVGSYKGAWSLLFVCIACNLAADFVKLLFPL